MADRGAGGSTAKCHCGRVSIDVAAPVSQVTYCNCSLCHTTGVRWFYVEADRIALPADPALTQTYAWNGEHVDFHRCTQCGCVTHWVPRDSARTRHGVNARLFPPQVSAAAEIEYQDGAETGVFADCPCTTDATRASSHKQ